jgi:hypothetical protein
MRAGVVIDGKINDFYKYWFIREDIKWIITG